MSRRRGGTPRRRSRGLHRKTTILIVGEGQQTEPNYFHGLKREDIVLARFAVTVKKGPGFSPERVVEEAIKYKRTAADRGEDYDEVWCVLDVEGPDKSESLRQAKAMAAREGIQLCLSNPAFEVWILSHFERIARYFQDCDAVVVELTKHWRINHGVEYDKGDEALYSRLSKRTQFGFENARWVREIHHRNEPDIANCNSSTDVYKLVGRLLGI